MAARTVNIGNITGSHSILIYGNHTKLFFAKFN